MNEVKVNLRDQVYEISESLTATERKLAAALLSDYPFAGLDPIQVFADRTHVSAASITRFVQKLGCSGYQDFQRRLIGELREGQKSPIDLRRISAPIGNHFLQDFVQRVCDVQQGVCDCVTEAQFVRISDLISDRRRRIFHIGGRMSDALAQYLSRHLRQVRPNIHHLSSDTETWPEYLFRMKSRDVFILFDFRRYEKRLENIARLAADEREVTIILVTDKWLSPVAKYSTEVIALPIECGTAWDSYCGAVGLIEALVAHVAERDWQTTRRRISEWDRLRLKSKAT